MPGYLISTHPRLLRQLLLLLLNVSRSVNKVPEQSGILVNVAKPTAIGPDAGDVVLVVEREVVALIGVEAEIVAEACEVPVGACVDVAVFTFL